MLTEILSMQWFGGMTCNFFSIVEMRQISHKFSKKKNSNEKELVPNDGVVVIFTLFQWRTSHW